MEKKKKNCTSVDETGDQNKKWPSGISGQKDGVGKWRFDILNNEKPSLIHAGETKVQDQGEGKYIIIPEYRF